MSEYRTPQEAGQIVSELRKGADMSQGALADALGVDPSAVSRIESGQRSLSAVEVVKLARLMDIPAERILMHDDPMAVLLRAGDAAQPEIEDACALVRSVIDDFLGMSSLLAR